MTYFTIVHILTLIVLFIIFILLLIVSFKETRAKIFWAMVFANFLVITTLSVFSMLVLDKYTKKARIENFSQKRILRNETISFTGKIRNIGKFTISKCFIEIKIINDPVSSKNIGGSDIFRPTSGIEYINKDEKASTVSKKFLISKDLKPKELKNFTVSMPYPPYFSKASTYEYLKCY